jgi:selenocysteine-specific elongation factor
VAAVYVICTAGHVDHGKSTLVKALTGMEPDRLAEERRRSMTIDLGFAWFDLAAGDKSSNKSGRESSAWTVAFVDLPGHCRFLGNMLAGAASVAVALVVVGADDGPMPQTFEHLEILDLLGVDHGVVAVTKTDLVDATTVGVAVELVREALAGTSLAQAPVVPVSGVTGHNLDALRESIRSVLAALPAEEDVGRPRLWVDRSFSVRGAGTVVTGTLRHGALAVDDEVVVLPGQRPARVRGLQSLGRQLDRAAAGGRVAVNLVGLRRGEVGRGDAVVRPGQWNDVRVLEAWVRALPDRPILRRGDWHLHCGSGEWRVELRPVNGRLVAAGEDGFVRVELAGPIPVAPGDRFVLRESGRQLTVGGGIVLDVAPGRPARGGSGRQARAARLAQRLDAVRAGDRIGLVVDHARAHGLVRDHDVMALAGLGSERDTTAADDRLAGLGGALVDARAAEGWRLAVVAAVRREHARRPLERAVARDLAMRAAVDAGCAPAVAAHVVADAVARQELAAEGAGVRLPAHRVRLSAQQAQAAERLIAVLNAAGFAPPDLPSASAAAGAAEVVRELAASGRLVRIAADLAITSEALDRAHDLLREAFLREGPLTASQAREVLATTRKYALPLLAALDQRGCTRRHGDLRIVLDRHP